VAIFRFCGIILNSNILLNLSLFFSLQMAVNLSFCLQQILSSFILLKWCLVLFSYFVKLLVTCFFSLRHFSHFFHWDISVIFLLRYFGYLSHC